MKRRALDPFEFRSRETVRRGVLRLAQHVAVHARRIPPSAAGDLPRAVHEARLSLKHARALLRLVSQGLEQTPPALTRLDAQLKKAAQVLAPARDIDVGQATLARLIQGSPARDRSRLDPLRHWLATQHRKQPVQPGPILAGLAAIPPLLDRVALSLDRAPWPKHAWRVLESSLQTGYRRARRRLASAADSGEASEFHRARTSTKRLMYQTRLLRSASPARAGRLSRQLDRIQKLLGDDHDLALLDASLERAPAKVGDSKSRKRLRATLALRQRKLRRRATRLAREAFQERPAPFASRLHRDWKSWRKRGARRS